MNDHRDDDERIRAAFDEQKGDDGRARSTYARVLAHEQPRRAKLLTSPVLRLAAAAVVLVAVSAAYRLAFVPQSKLTVPNEVVALVDWRPVTDMLLTSPVKTLRMQESMIELDTLTTGAFR